LILHQQKKQLWLGECTPTRYRMSSAAVRLARRLLERQQEQQQKQSSEVLEGVNTTPFQEEEEDEELFSRIATTCAALATNELEDPSQSTQKREAAGDSVAELNVLVSHNSGSSGIVVWEETTGKSGGGRGVFAQSRASAAGTVWRERPLVFCAYTFAKTKTDNNGPKKRSRNTRRAVSLLCGACAAPLPLSSEGGDNRGEEKVDISCDCGVERYCSASCRARHWDVEHEYLCGRKFAGLVSWGLRQGSTLFMKHTVLCAKILARSGGGASSGETLRALDSLCEGPPARRVPNSRTPHIDAEALGDVLRAVFAGRIRLSADGGDLAAQVHHTLRVLAANLHGFCAPGEPSWMSDLGGSGGALLLVGSMFNHSCCPNVRVSVRVPAAAADASSGSGSPLEMQFVLRSDVVAGDELCISYVPGDVEPDVRYTLLKDVYGFECACPKCL
jgi:SET domain